MRTLFLLVLAACGTPSENADQAVAPEAHEAHEAAAPAEATAAAGDWASFGAPVTEGEIVSIAAFLDDPTPYEGKSVRVQGKVTDVCQKAGCWMVMTDDTRHLRVTMKDHDFSVDKQGAGADCIVEGVVKSKAVDPKEVAHFKSESSEGAVIPEEQAQSDKTWEIVAAGVKMRKES
ncbi:MAG: DUF4920 domain-containing protein [Deltaproteobacteria bacterium]|nr:MAG: DUF4920 domain-containing protein [Deltaproteobacteria bacterium]